MDPAAERLAPLLACLVDHERLRSTLQGWDLATTRRLLARPDLAPPVRPAVQVGGSKGKGTTCAFLEALVSAAGGRAGVYSSPHLSTLLERIRCGGRRIPLDVLEPLLRRILQVPCTPPDRAPTFFEVMTVAAAEWFAAERVELAIYEIGLGGRFDATTALPVDANVITTVELEHTEMLGETVAAIAAEKAASVRPGGVAFTAASRAAVEVVRAHCEDVGARLHVLGGSEWSLRALEFTGAGARFRLRLPRGGEREVFLPDAREVEVPALAIAAAVLEEVRPDLALSLDPAPRPFLPGRFEVLRESDGEVLVLDSAHTEQSMRALAAELARRWPGQKAAILFATAAGKRWQEGLSALLPIADTVVVTGLVGTSSEDPEVVASWLAARGITSELAADAESGLAALRRRAGPRVVVGSFYLVGPVRETALETSAAKNSDEPT